MKQKANNSNISYLIAVIILVLAFLLIRPLLTLLITAGILAYLFYPIYIRVLGLFGKANNFTTRGSAFLVILCIIAVILSPLITIVTLLTLNAELIKSFLTINLPAAFQGIAGYIKSNMLFFNKFSLIYDTLLNNLYSMINMVSAGILKIFQELISRIPQGILDIFIILFLTYYLIHNAQGIINYLQDLIPFSKQQKAKIFSNFNGLCRGMLYSQLVVAIFQAILVFLACLIIGVKHVVLISFLTLILALIPFMGAFIIWGSLTIYLFINVPAIPIWKPIFMLLYGSLIVSTVDNIIRPKILSDSAAINPAVVLVGFIGGFLLFGLPGILIGPVILTMVELAIDILKETKK